MIDRKWDRRFLELAAHVAGWSKDPSTKVGAVIVRPDRTIVSLGFNGFPRGVQDLDERYAERQTKYSLIVHGELNAILTAREPLHGTTLYTWPFCPCSDCAKLVIQAGVKRVVAPVSDNSRWVESFKLTMLMFQEAGVQLELLESAPEPAE